MSKLSIGKWIGLSVILLFPLYSQATDLVWKILAIDTRTKAPVDGASVEVIVTDLNENKKESKSQCITNANGNCVLNASVSGGWFTGSSFNRVLSVSKEGYTSKFSIITKNTSDSEYETTLSMLSIEALEEQKNWALGEGPSIDTYTGLQPTRIIDLTVANTSVSQERGKFETEQAFTARMATAGKLLIVVPLLTSDQKFCVSNYEHKSQTYFINNCLAFPHGKSLAIRETEGTSLTLSNAYDSRKIKRILLSEYSISGLNGFHWTNKFKLSPQEAEILESDLMAAVEVEGVGVSSTCSTCEGRDESDLVDKTVALVNELTKSYSPSRSDGWKNEAFKSGSITEGWKIVVTPKKYSRYFVYRKSDKKLLFETRVN